MAFSICIFAIAFFVGSVAQDSFGGNQGGFGGQQGGFGGPQGGFGGNQGGFGGNQGGLWGQQGGFGGQQSGFGGNQGGFGGPQGGFGGNQGFGGPQGGFGGNQGFGGPVGFGGNQRGGFSSYGGPGGGLAGLVLGDNNLTFPFPTFLQGLNRTDVRAFKRIAFNSSATPNEIESGLQTWANNQSSDVQTEFTQWTQNVTNFVTEIVSDADTIAANMSSNGQAVYEEVKTIILNANLTRKGKCAELISLAENSTVGAVLEVIQTFPILLNSCGFRGGRHGHHGPGGRGGLPQGGFGGFGGGFPSGFSGPQNGFGGFGNPAFVGVGAQTSVEVVYFDPDSN